MQFRRETRGKQNWSNTEIRKNASPREYAESRYAEKVPNPYQMDTITPRVSITSSSRVPNPDISLTGITTQR